MRAAEGFLWWKCGSCQEMYEVAKNPWNPTAPKCIMRTATGKCGGTMALVKSGGPRRPLDIPAASKEDGADLEAMLAPRGELDRRLS